MDNVFEARRRQMHEYRFNELIKQVTELEKLCKSLAHNQPRLLAQFCEGLITYIEFNMHLLDYSATVNRLASDIAEADMLIVMIGKGGLL